MVKKDLKKYGGTGYKYIVEKVDVNNNGRFDDPVDGILIKRFTINSNNKKMFDTQIFVLNKDVADFFENFYKDNDLHFQNVKNNKTNYNKDVKEVSHEQIIRYENGANLPSSQHVVYEQQTSFGEYVKMGAGTEIGRKAVDMLFDFAFGGD